MYEAIKTPTAVYENICDEIELVSSHLSALNKPPNCPGPSPMNCLPACIYILESASVFQHHL